MPYITVSNSRKIIRNLDEDRLASISEKLYKWDIYFFSRRERAFLNAIREFMRDPNTFALQYYNPVKVVDTYRYVYPESQPAYHKDNTCEKLKSNFLNIEIPHLIRERGTEEVCKFREWFKSTSFDPNDAVDYIYKLQIRFPYLGAINPNTVNYSNSGFKEQEDYSLPELEKEIDKLLRAAADYFKNNPKLQPIIRRYQKWTFLAYVYGDINNNESGLNDAELKAFLRSYDESFKKPVKYLLCEYYRVKFNPEMSFEGNLLATLGFKMCRHCLSENNNILFDPAINTIEVNDDLPF